MANQPKRKRRPDSPQPDSTPSPSNPWIPVALLILVAIIGGVIYMMDPVSIFAPIEPITTADRQPRATSNAPAAGAGRKYEFGDNVTLLWEDLLNNASATSFANQQHSNIRAADYAGPESCRKCHPQNYNHWSQHTHRFMNTLASEETVLGDFSNQQISYLGGKAHFYRDGDKFYMRLERTPIRRVYHITQTIGSRFFQYYIGVQVQGPEPTDHPFYREEHVLPFGYWLEPKEWVPTVHVGPEMPDGQRLDPYQPPASGPFYHEYANSCSHCHSTYPFGDWLIRQADLAALHAPEPLQFQMASFLEEAHPQLKPPQRPASDFSEQELMHVLMSMETFGDVRQHAVSFGVTCEACHYGSKEHAEGKLKSPLFFPASQHLFRQDKEPDYGRTHENINWTCGRCHIGARPQYANGISTWNSTEFSDAMQGACYSEMTCVDCHNPHQSIGQKWTASPRQDTNTCLKCHQEYRDPQRLQQHTHHGVDSTGSQCMNCHMPRINEGLQDLVRTHTIFSPTDPKMIESNQPNACSMCHVDHSIDQTLTALREWYGKEYDQEKIDANYPSRERPVAEGWLKSESESVRLIGADSLIREKGRDALPQLLDALDDPYLINRQFAGRGIEKLLNIRLSNFGYRFYMSPEERAGPLNDLRKLIESTATIPAADDVASE